MTWEQFYKPLPLNASAEYERGFIDGMQKQMQSSVDKAVNRMATPQYLNASYEGDDLYTGEQLRAAVAAEREACAKLCENIGVNIELSRRMAAVKVSNFYGSIIKDAEKEIQRLHGLVLQHTAPRQPLTEEEMLEILVGIDAETKRLPPGMKAFARAIERAHGIGGEHE